MGQISTVYISLTCEGPGCDKTVTFLASKEQEELTKPENNWAIKTARRVLNLVPPVGQQKPVEHLYCGDVCEIKATETGRHNVPEPKRIIEGAASAQAVQQAAQAAKAAEEATRQMKAGQPVTLG